MGFKDWQDFYNGMNGDIEKMARYSFSNEINKKNRDPDRSELAISMYELLLLAQGCEKVSVVFFYSEDEQKKKYKEDLQNKIANIKLVKNPRPGFCFKYKDKWYALEVDTLIGSDTYRDIVGKDDTDDLLHTFGNLGLVPFGSGYFTTFKFKDKKVKTDYLKHKISHSFDTGFERPSGFGNPEDIYKLLLYSSLCGIDRNSSKESIDNGILERGKSVIKKISEYYWER